MKASWRHLCKTSWRSLEVVLMTSWRCHEDVLKTSWRCLEDVFTRRLEDILKMFWRHMTKTNILVLIKTSWRRLLKTYKYSEYVRLDQDVLKTSSEDEGKRRLQDVFIKTNVCWVTHFQTMFHFYTPWKHQKNWCFRGYRRGTLVENGLNIKNWISWEPSITFPGNAKIITFCLKDYISRNYLYFFHYKDV